MQESKLLDKLLPAPPDFAPTVWQWRDKYGLQELARDDEPIEKLFFNGEAVSLEGFSQELESPVQAATNDTDPSTSIQRTTRTPLISGGGRRRYCKRR